VPEQLAFEQLGRNRRAVHFHKRPISAFAPGVDGARDEFLARTGLTLNQNRRASGRHHPDLIQNGTQCRA